MESAVVLLCSHPLSKSILQSYGKRGQWPGCFMRRIIPGVFSTAVRVSYVEILLLVFLFGKCLLYTCCQPQISTLEIQETITQVKELSTFPCMGRHKSQGSLKWLPWYILQLAEGMGSYIPSISSGFTTGSGCRLTDPRYRIFSFSADQHMLEGCDCWFQCSGFPLLVMNVTNIWETFHYQHLSHGIGRLHPV